MLWHPGVQHRHAFYVTLIDRRLVPWDPRRSITIPGKGLIDDDGLRHPTSRVTRIKDKVVDRTGSSTRAHFISPINRSGHRFGVRIDQQLRPVEPESVSWIPGAVDAVTVQTPRTHVGQVTAPHPVGGWRHHYGLCRN